MSSAEPLTGLVSDGQAELREGYADVGDDLRLHYVEDGDGPLVVLLAYSSSWDCVIERLQSTGIQVTG